jgi:hypothetical protein
MRNALGSSLSTLSIPNIDTKFVSVRRRIRHKTTNSAVEKLKLFSKVSTGKTRAFSPWFDEQLKTYIDVTNEEFFFLGYPRIERLVSEQEGCNQIQLDVEISHQTYLLLQEKSIYCVREFIMSHEEAQKTIVAMFLSSALSEAKVFID